MVRVAKEKIPVEISKVPKDKLAKLKYLTKWINNPSLSTELLISDKNEFNTSLKYRLFNYFLNNPKICLYLNKYLNNFYIFVSVYYEPNDWLSTFSQIYQKSNIKNLWITKYQNPKRSQFTKLLDDYYNLIGDLELNQSEINNLFTLFEHNIISNKHIEQLQLSLSKKGSKESIQSIPIFNTTVVDNKTNSSEVIEFCSNMIANINNRPQCKYCPGNKKGTLVLEAQNYTSLDVLIIGSLPNQDDIRNQKFISNHDVFKSNLNITLDKFKLSYGYSNRILCTNQNTDDTTLKKMADNCSGFSTLVHDIPKPKLKIVLGVKTAKLMGLKATAKSIGTNIGDNIFILPDPDDIDIDDKKILDKLNIYFSNLEKYISYKVSDWSLLNKAENQVDDIQLLPSGVINSKYTLFDIQVIHGSVLYIVLDENNQKQFITNNITYPVYIKKGKFNECNYIDGDMDFIANLTIFEKQMLSQKLNENIKSQILKQKPQDEVDEVDEVEYSTDDDEMF